jgi:hypothetical protein
MYHFYTLYIHDHKNFRFFVNTFTSLAVACKLPQPKGDNSELQFLDFNQLMTRVLEYIDIIYFAPRISLPEFYDERRVSFLKYFMLRQSFSQMWINNYLIYNNQLIAVTLDN